MKVFYRVVEVAAVACEPGCLVAAVGVLIHIDRCIKGMQD
jgi:hypothetical protein